jgi:hypothetical protein
MMCAGAAFINRLRRGPLPFVLRASIEKANKQTALSLGTFTSTVHILQLDVEDNELQRASWSTH